ncbi:hypothetical protein niasHT_019389 [Heterodera trifolii]|uniref:Uncharacterized protein n=1 Tax=Heterodera trifolii TaxID=157864 RepID=A0ABD2KVW2_9BILA
MGSSLGHDDVIIATFANICIIYSSVICYLILYAKLKWDERKANGKTVVASQPLIFKSISLILLLQVVGWSGGIIAFFVVSIHFGDDDLNLQKFLADSVINCFISVCGTFETPVLFFHSSEHQKAMRKEWRNIVQLVKKCFPTTFGRNNKIGTAVVLVVSRPGKPTPNRIIQSAHCFGSTQIGRSNNGTLSAVGSARGQFSSGWHHQQQQTAASADKINQILTD